MKKEIVDFLSCQSSNIWVYCCFVCKSFLVYGVLIIFMMKLSFTSVSNYFLISSICFLYIAIHSSIWERHTGSLYREIEYFGYMVYVKSMFWNVSIVFHWKIPTSRRQIHVYLSHKKVTRKLLFVF